MTNPRPWQCLLWVLLYLHLLGGFAVVVVVLVNLGHPLVIAIGVPTLISAAAVRAATGVKQLALTPA